MKISERNRNEAIRNIRLKISLLKEVFSNSDLQTDEYYPKTIRQFNSWDLSQNTLKFRDDIAPISRNANDTLNKYPDLKSEVVASLHALMLVRNKSSSIDRTDKIGKLKEEILRLKKYINVLESYTASQKLELVRVNELLEDKVNSLSCAITELKRRLRDANSN
ncbi:hypothetical protein HFK74_07730|uniref:hypothetical protein n=1 Tax=Pseudomonas sp. SbOxS1 TaxID=2723884 RepID=UPI0015D3FE21|nr:hypothetical protein [Pseudomonas sp. SbOxS1]NYU02586.1 hypothetical protein [Pseudomonas sp. SbOxS1]